MRMIDWLAGAALVLALAATPASAAEKGHVPDAKASADASADAKDKGVALFKPYAVTTNGSVTIAGQRVDYRAVAGTIVVHAPDYDDAAWRAQAEKDRDPASAPAEAAMSYVAYFRNGAPSANRPVTFLYNGGPGSSTVWLHMGAFGPKRVVTADDSHTPAAPYRIVDNGYSLLDASDLVFIDAPGTGFGRVAGKDKEKAFFGIDADAAAFASFIRQFLSQYGRWNSPKFLFGESYGTPRSAVLVNALAGQHSVDVNGVILLSQILDFNLFAGLQQANPGNVEGYVVQVPTFAATAWYHNHLPGGRPGELEPFLAEVEKFATTDYAAALAQGAEIDPKTKQAVAERLSRYIGLPTALILKADLRIDGPTFSKHLLEDQGLTTGRLDSRFSGPDLDPLSKDAEYDPVDAAISSAYVSAYNSYARDTLGWGHDQDFKPQVDVFGAWDWGHAAPGVPPFKMVGTSVMGDIAAAMKMNPQLKVLVAGGYYDLGTPFYQGWYEMHHLPIPAALQSNIDYRYYPSGHMIYAHEDSLRRFHDDVAAFIRHNQGG